LDLNSSGNKAFVVVAVTYKNMLPVEVENDDVLLEKLELTAILFDLFCFT